MPPPISESEPVGASDPIPPLVANPEPEPLPAAVIPDSPQPEIPAEVKDNEITIRLGGRRYRVRGLEKNLAYDALKINLLVSRPSLDGAGESIHIDTFDLYQQRPRGVFIKQAAIELGLKESVIKSDLGKLLLKLEALQAQRLEAAQAPKEKTVTLDDEATRAALELLRSPDLLARIERDLSRCGVVGEATNKQVAYLATLSRKLDRPLAVTIQSTSAAGKSSLMDAVLALVPPEERIKYSAMTGQSLFYMGETDLQHKILAIAEEEGASNAAYALKLLQSEGELTIASTGKDPTTGELKTQAYQVKGPVMILLTTTAIDVDEELLNRCLVLTVDEGREQAILNLHQNAQRLLEPLAVVNPYAQSLSFIDDRTRTRRDHEKYLTLIDSLALLHQHQRPIKTVIHQNEAIRYVEANLEDIAQANRLAHEVLGRTLDELPPQTRKLLHLIVELVAEQCTRQAMERSDYRFSRQEVRAHTNWSDTALKIHLARLAEMEYLLVHRGGRGQSYAYELLYSGDGCDDAPHLSGLIDVARLREKQGYDERRSEKAQRSGSDQPPVGGQSGGGHEVKTSANAGKNGTSGNTDEEEAEKGLIRPRRGNGSYRNDSPAILAKGLD